MGAEETKEEIEISDNENEISDKPEEDKLSLEERAIIKDIETSSKYELDIWAESLGLVTGGSKDALQRSISNYYGVELTAKKAEKSEKKVISINSAELSRYYTLEEVDESVAEFEGRVEIIIDDEEGEIQHSIIADKIIFNRTHNSVSAIGNVEYVKNEKGKPETVTAESMTFNLDNWQGSLIKCISKQDKTIEEEDMVFYYVTGEIKKSDTDIMGMNKVTIQTVIGSPYFNISAYDLWMLGASEFVMILPSMKVGNVPVFIAPFYYHTDNTLFFNPVYGVRSREGTISQNTLYIMGNKEPNDEESDFSFLSFDTGEETTNYELNGLSLVPSDSKKKYSDDYIKFMLDYYSKLGLFMGSGAEINISEPKISLDWDLGVGFSRNITDDGEVFFNGESEWNSSTLYEEDVPFRYGIDMSLSLPFVDVTYKNYSDSYFLMDFYHRTEHFQWVDHFTDQLADGVENLTEEGDVDNYSRTSEGDAKEVKSYSWGVDFKDPNLKPDILKPFISSIKLDSKNLEVTYSRKEDKKLSEESTEENVIYEDKFQSYDPMYYFFYPDTIKYPVTLTLKGSLFDTDFKKKESTKEEDKKDLYDPENDLFDLENPLVDKTEETEEVVEETRDTDLFTLSSDDLYKEVTIKKSEEKIISTKLGYTITQPLTVKGIWDDEEWVTLEDINYDLEEKDVLYEFNPSAKADWSLDLFDSILSLDNSISMKHYKKSYLENLEQSDLKTIYKNNSTELENSAKVELKLFDFKSIYSLDTILYKRSFDEELYTEDGKEEDFYKTEEFEWEEDYIEKHKLEMDYNYNIGISTSTLSYDKILPPLEESDKISLKEVVNFTPNSEQKYKSTSTATYTRTIKEEEVETEEETEEPEVEEVETEVINLDQSFDFDVLGFTTTISGGADYSESFIDEENDEWDLEPIKGTLGYKFSDDYKISVSSQYNLEDEVWDDLSGTLNIGQLSLTVKSDYEIPYVWNGDVDVLRWEQDGEEKELQLHTLTLTHSFDLAKFRFWKNRITLDIDSDLKVYKNFIKVDKSSLLYNLKFNLDIFQFLTLNIKSTSENKALFLYFEDDYTELGLPNQGKNIFTDLFKSFNFLDEDDRKESSFNLKKIEIGATYKMPDWNLVFSYSGVPKLEDEEYKWYEVFSFFIEWKPLSLVRSNIVNDDENWTVKTSKD